MEQQLQDQAGNHQGLEGRARGRDYPGPPWEDPPWEGPPLKSPPLEDPPWEGPPWRGPPSVLLAGPLAC